MSIVYRIYSNRGDGGPVDESAPVASTSGLSHAFAPVDPATDTTFVVRAFDTETNLEESNTGARVRVVIGQDGEEVRTRPNPPHAVSVSPVSGGGCRVSWAYVPADSSGRPDGFHVYVEPTSAVGSPSPAATAGYAPGRIGSSVVLPGPFAAAAYAVTVVAFNAAGEGVGARQSTSLAGFPAAAFEMGPVDVSDH